MSNLIVSSKALEIRRQEKRYWSTSYV